MPKTLTSTSAALVISPAVQVKLITWPEALVTETSVPARTEPPASHSSIRAVGVPVPQFPTDFRTAARNT
jgi:hypothetical protein